MKTRHHINRDSKKNSPGGGIKAAVGQRRGKTPAAAWSQPRSSAREMSPSPFPSISSKRRCRCSGLRAPARGQPNTRHKKNPPPSSLKLRLLFNYQPPPTPTHQMRNPCLLKIKYPPCPTIFPTLTTPLNPKPSTPPHLCRTASAASHQPHGNQAASSFSNYAIRRDQKLGGKNR